MGVSCSREEKITKTIILTQPVLKPSGEVIYSGTAKQTVQGNISSDKTAPLYLRRLHTWAWENAQHHHTKKFALPRAGTLVVRRGQPFKMTLTFNRPYNSLTDELKFFFETGESPLPGNDTMVCLSSYTSQGSSGWKSDFLPVIGTKKRDCIEAHLWVFTPVDCIVSDWKFHMQSILRTDTDTATVAYEHPERIYILFNPWCKDDATYFPAEPLLDEYILNAGGIMFQGCRKMMTIKPWIYGQFESGILEACFYIIKRSFNFRTSQAMGDVVTVARNISSIINAEDRHGVLKGSWSTNDFTDGRSPTTWSGSVAILKQYVTNALANKTENPEPVKYGHCFVYAGLVTTICRAIGIPCRCVTNYNSGRGTDGQLNIDFYYDLLDDGSIAEVVDHNREAVWNFHVWNDVWMRRSDLSIPHNEPDWQALDATPHISTSNAFHRCGPAPLHAIKNGLTDLKYDIGFLFAEVNADVLHWLKVDMANWTVFKVEQARVGRSISTKSPDGRPARLTFKLNAAELNRVRHDITADYKYKRGTKIEQDIVRRPHRRERPMHRCKARDVNMKLEEKEYETMGADFYVKATITNNSDAIRTGSVLLLCDTVHYTGEVLQLGIYEDDYIRKLAEHCCMRQYGLVRMKETDQIEAWVDEFLIKKPHLEMQVENTVYKGSNFALKLSFTNPLHRPLKRCAVSLEGVGIESMLYVRNFENVPAQCEWTGVINLMPIRTKDLEISATFYCREMLDIVGTTVVKVQKEQVVEEEEEPELMTSSVPAVFNTQYSTEDMKTSQEIKKS